jgi:hypothetical protein
MKETHLKGMETLKIEHQEKVNLSMQERSTISEYEERVHEIEE